MKHMGLILLFSAVVMIGTAYVTRLHERVRLLKAFKLQMQSIKRRFSVSRPPFTELFSDDDDPLTKPFSQLICECMKNGASAKDAVTAAFSSSCVPGFLKKDERKFLAGIYVSLSLCDIVSALGTLDNACEELDSYIEAAAQCERKNAKPVMSAAVYIGLAAVILLW